MSTTNREIYQNALSLLGELEDPMSCEDYEERAPYIIASFCSLAAEIDKRIRVIDKSEAQSSFSPVFLSLESAFPLSSRLVPTAALYLAAMLVLDEDQELSDSLYDKYCDAIASVSASIGISDNSDSPSAPICAECESIVERYFFD